MKRRIIITTLLLAAIHFVLAVGSLMMAYGSGMEAFDNPDYEPPVLERVAGAASKVLMQPGQSLWTSWTSKNIPNRVEWGFFVLNSVLWGFVLALILNLPRLLKGR